MPGPIPERSENRRRRNKPEIPETTPKNTDHKVDWGKPDPEWHPLMVEAYEALQVSPQSEYATQADVAQARITLTVWSLQLSRSGGPTAQALGALFSSLDSLMMSEGARRRLRIEVAKQDRADKAPVLDIVERRRRAAGG